MSDRISTLQKYTPSRHGEQGVDAVIHGIIEENDDIHEIFCNPPGGSWTEFDIIHPTGKTISRWDHIPRRPTGVKRPDQVFQYLGKDRITLLSIESKYDRNDLTSDIGEKLTGYIDGHESYTGMRERPCWHTKARDEEKWHVVPPTASNEDRFWFRDSNNVDYWTGFLFSNSPLDLTKENEIETALDATLTESDVDVALSVSWVGKQQMPLLYMKGTEEFRTTPMSTALQDHLGVHNSDIETP